MTDERFEATERASSPVTDSTAVQVRGGDPTLQSGDPRPRKSLPRGTAIGRYLLVSELGAGGMGVVYAAYDPELDRKVAIKLLHSEGVGRSTREGKTRLLREAQALAKLAHPNVVAVHDVGTYGDEVFLAMEFVDGESLGRWAKAARRSWRDKLRAIVDAGRGVAAAHAAGLLHRDLKPDNIMVGVDGRVRVMDLGLARAQAAIRSEAPAFDQDTAMGPELAALAQPLTQVGVITGTPAYMAPEQFRGEAIGTAADQFALCVTAWELLAGERPYSGTTLIHLAANVLAGKRAPAPRRTEVPRWVWPVLERGLAPQADQRWPSIDALLVALDRGHARARGRKVLAGVAVLAIGGYGLASWSNTRRTRLEERAAASEIMAKDLEKTANAANASADAARRAEKNALLLAVARYLDDPTERAAVLREVGGQTMTERWLETAEPLRWANLGLRALITHDDGVVMDVVYSPDGERIATASVDKTAKIWPTESFGHPVVLVGHSDVLYSVVFSPDGSRVLTTSADGTARVWDTAGTALLSLPTADGRASGFSPDGALIATPDEHGTVHLWDAERGVRLQSLDGHTSSVRDLEFSQDGTRLLTVSADKTARIWEPLSATPPVVLTHGEALFGGTLSPDNSLVVTHGEGPSAFLWRTSGEGGVQLLSGHAGQLIGAQFSPGGTHVTTFSFGASVIDWDLGESDDPRPTVLEQQVISHVSPVGERFATVSVEGSVLVWNANSPPVEVGVAPGGVRRLRFSPDGSSLALVGMDGSVRVWEVDEEADPLVFASKDAKPVWYASYSQDGARIITSPNGGTGQVWNSDGSGKASLFDLGFVEDVIPVEAAGDWVAAAYPDHTVRARRIEEDSATIILRGHEGRINSIAFDRLASHLVTASSDGSSRIWALDGSAPVVLQHPGQVHRAGFSPNGELVVTASSDDVVRVWSRSDLSQPAALLRHPVFVMAFEFSPDGRRLVTTGQDATARVWDVDGGGEPLVLTGHSLGVTSATFNSDGSKLLTTGLDRLAMIWDIDGGGDPIVLHHDLPVWSGDFGPDDTLVVTASGSDARVWGSDGVLRGSLEGHTDSVLSARFSPNGEQILTRSSDGTARVWSTRRVTSDLRALLWQVPFCHSPEFRVEAFGESGEVAEQKYQRCLVLTKFCAEASHEDCRARLSEAL